MDVPENLQPWTDNTTRLEADLEMVQSLANPRYLEYLAHRGFFEDPAFLNYLQYLEYFRKVEYSKFLTYPNCLQFLTLLKQPKFRDALKNPAKVNEINDALFFNYNNRYQAEEDCVKMEGVEDGIATEAQP